MAEARMEQIGKVAGFFSHVGAAVVELTASLRVGDRIYLKGHTTDFQQVVASMQVDRQDVQEAAAGQSVGLKVDQRCRQHDVVYKLVA